MQNRGIVLPLVLFTVFTAAFLSAFVLYPQLVTNNDSGEGTVPAVTLPTSTLIIEPTAVEQKKENSINNLDFEIPLFSKVKWGNVKEVKKEDSLYSVFITDTTDDSVFEDPYYLDGKAVSATVNNVELKNEFENFYDEELTGKDWKQNPFIVNNIRITPYIAEGPTGGSYGYVQLENGIIQLVVLTNITYGDNPIKLELFVSEKVGLNTIINEVKKQN